MSATTTAAHDATATRFCKVPGCPREAMAKHGTYALLCDEHKAAKRRGYARAAPDPAAPSLRVIVDGSREAAARNLMAAGRKVDKARARADIARRKVEPALQALRVAESEWEQAIESLRGRRSGLV